MTEQIENSALYEKINQVIVDVRSPLEYEENHISNAINIPLFSNEERAVIGTAYKRKSALEAKKLGLSFIANKIEQIGHEIIELSTQYDRIIIYCQKGGMRSGSICDLMNALDVKVFQLKDGMKGHRKYIETVFSTEVPKKTFVTLHGHTGVGKTKILEGLRAAGLDVINYEALAQNAGSVFGNILFQGEPPNQKYFEEMLCHHIMTAKSDYIFIESESRRVGTILIPDPFMKALEDGLHIFIDTTLENRIDNLIDDYGDHNQDAGLIAAINKLRKRISNNKADELIDYVKNDNLKPLVAYLLKDYYDPLYQYSIDQYDYMKTINYETIQEATETILDIYQKGF